MIIKANGAEISVLLSSEQQNDYISLTDIAKYKNPNDPRIVISNWLSSYSTIDFLAAWETLYNPDFNRMEFHTVRNEPGRLVLTAKQWIERMNAIGITSHAGRYGGTYAHSDIAFEFASWISPELTPQEINYKYASEADMLNMALFGKTAKQWRDETGNKKENMRDYASVEQLIILVNIESMNADMIREGIPMSERLKKLRSVAYYQMQSLTRNKSIERIKDNLIDSKSGNNN